MRAFISSVPASVCARAPAAVKSTPKRAKSDICRRIVIMPTIVAESTLVSRCDFVDEFVGAILACPDGSQPMTRFKKIVALLQISPESYQLRLIAARYFQGFETVACEPRGENLNRQALPPLMVDQDREPINFFDAIIRDGNAANR